VIDPKTEFSFPDNTDVFALGNNASHFYNATHNLEAAQEC
jgi:hypothetical protein